MNTPQNHHGNCHYPALAVSAVRSRMGKTKAHPPSQVGAEGDWRGTGKTSVNGGAPQSVSQAQKAGISLDSSFSHMWVVFL